MRLTTAEIDRYGPLTGCRPSCEEDITIVAGPNESGKTLYLEGVLQLLEPDVTAHMDPGPRINQSPTGQVIVEDGSDRHSVGDGTALSDISRIDPNHLYNLFIIRDSDLVLPDGSEYYTSLVEHLGDIHTTEIEKMRDGLVDDGRLTPTNLNLADRSYNTKEVKQEADSLADDIEAYLETAEEHEGNASLPSLSRQFSSAEINMDLTRCGLLIERAQKLAELYRDMVIGTGLSRCGLRNGSQCGEGDEAIIDAYDEYDREYRSDILLFSNDRNFVERAQAHRMLGQRVDFPAEFPETATASWREIEILLYMLAVVFGIIEVPSVTVYGVWRGKDELDWQHERLKLDARSPKLKPKLTGDLSIVDSHEELSGQ